jgi:hypothetical protein
LLTVELHSLFSDHLTLCTNRAFKSAFRIIVAVSFLGSAGLSFGQIAASERPVPILTGSAGFFTDITGGHASLNPTVVPVVLVPIGQRWLFETRAEFEGDFARKSSDGSFGGDVEKEIHYLQVDYIANRHVTVTAGRFLTPFGIFNERLYPIWIRNLQQVPLIFPIGTGPSDGVMLRGGFSASSSVNINYAAYFSTLSTINKLDSDRMAGGRIGVFLPKPRLELGVSFQKTLQEERPHAVGFHFAWQPNALPVTIRSEYAHSGDKGSGYWVEGAYRLSQINRWQGFFKHLEIVGRGQQFFADHIESGEAEEYGLPDVDARQGDLGLNYNLHDGLKLTASYGRQFGSDGNLNVWTAGIAYRFALPLGGFGTK